MPGMRPAKSQSQAGGPGGRAAPRDMPRDVPAGSRVPPQPEKQPDVLPKQHKIGEELAQAPPKRWKVIAKRVAMLLLVVVALVMAYLFLLMGEPSNEKEIPPPVQEEAIRVPMTAMEAPGNADLSALAANFGRPVLALYGGAVLQRCSLYDTAFQGGYARRVTLTYAFADGETVLVESIRPTAAAALLAAHGAGTLKMDARYVLAGVESARMDTRDAICIFGQSPEVVYAITCPVSHATDVNTLVKQTMLAQPQVPGQ